jgi:PAS domain S-box-containing protein
MAAKERYSGIDVVGDVPWGTHSALFYRTKQDLVDVLVPYFKAGLESNEFCMWVTSEYLNTGEAKACMAEALPDFDIYMDKGQIEIIPYMEWYKIDGVFDPERVLNGWIEKLRKARERGFSGLRLTGDTFWLEPGVWKDFIDYERTVNDVIGQYDILALCSYSLDKCDANDVLDVVGTHEFALTKRKGEWKIIEDKRHKKARTALWESEEKFRILADSSQAGIILVQGENIVYINQTLADIGGYTVEECLNKNFLDFIHPDFRELLWQRGSAAQHGGKIVQHRYEAKIIRKDGGERWLDISPGLIIYNGMPALIVTAMDITERKRAEDALRDKERQLAEAQALTRTGSWVMDLATGQVDFSDEMLRILVLSPGRHTYDEYRDRVHPADRARRDDAVRDSIAGNKLYVADYRIVMPDGSVRNIQAIGKAERDAGGKPLKFTSTIQDVTERKRAEEAIEESRAKLEAVFASMNDGVCLVDANQNIVSVNEAFAHFHRFECKEAYIKTVGEYGDFFELYTLDGKPVPMEDWPAFRGLRGETASNFEVSLKRTDTGDQWYGNYSHAPIRDKEDKIVGSVLTMRDITEQKRAEEALRESEEKYRIVADNTYDWEFWLSPKGDFIYTSPSCERITGYTSDEFKKDPGLLLSIVHPADREALEKHLAEKNTCAVHGDLEFRVTTRAGDMRWVHHMCQPVFDEQGRFLGSRGSNRDITEHKRAEEAARAADVRFRSLIQNSMDIIRILDRDGRIVYDSPSSEKILGYPEGSTLGRSPLEFIHPDDLEYVKNDLGAVCDNKNSGMPTEFRIRKADGSYLDGESTGMNMIGVPGVDGIVITTRPITERKRAEKELKAAKQQAELYLDLMCHDINNLHQIALGYLELASNAPPGEEQAEFLNKPVEVLQRSAQLIGNVRKLQKLNEGVFQAQDVDVSRMLGDVQIEFGAIPNKRVTLNVHGHGPCLVRANELLHDVFANLVSNAIKHTGDHTNIIIDFDVVKDNGGRYCRVVVEDDGPGIPDDFKATIFDRTLKGTNKAWGMGLGLYLVKSLVDSYDGRVWLEDRVKGDHTKGARFVVMLPAMEK